MFARGHQIRRWAGHGFAACHAAVLARLMDRREGRRRFDRVVVAANLGRHNGIAEGARLQHAALRQLGVDAELLDVTAAARNPLFRAPHRPGTAYVFHAGAPQTAAMIGAALPHAAHAWRIGYWAWELPDPPAGWAGCDALVDEIWTPSTFSQASLARAFDTPVLTVPHVVPPQPPAPPQPARPFTVLTMADTRSSLSRKNPAGALRAFLAAFGPSPSARIVVKLTGPAAQVRAFQEAHANLLADTGATVISEQLDDAGIAALFRQSDALLSLHRAEGYGLPLREAMAHGLPVVASAWSGNMDFMAGHDSCLVPCALVPIEDEAGIYGAGPGGMWADPDLDAAAAVLRRLEAEPAFRRHIGAAALRSVQESRADFPFDPPAATATTAVDRAMGAVS